MVEAADRQRFLICCLRSGPHPWRTKWHGVRIEPPCDPPAQTGMTGSEPRVSRPFVDANRETVGPWGGR